MSVDIRLAHPCPHLVLEEVVALTADRRSLPTSCPVAAANATRILVNDSFFVPSSGLYDPATLTASVRGPYRVPVCDRTLTVTTSTGSATVALVPGADGLVQAGAVARLLTAALPDASVGVTDGRLSVTDLGSVGPSSVVQASGPGAPWVGFRVQRGAVGRTVYPGWEVVGEPSSPLGRYPMFREPLRNNASFKVSYSTYPVRCRRCGGTFVENDWEYDLQGDALMVANEDLLVQEVLKIILTRTGSNAYFPTYGTGIVDSIGRKASSTTASDIRTQVREALRVVSLSQGTQAKFQQLTLEERLYTVNAVDVTQSAEDPTVFLVDVTVTNASTRPVRVSIVYTAPGAVALAGTNGLSLGTQAAGLR